MLDLAIEQALTCLLFVDARCSCAQCYQADAIRGYRVIRKDPSRILRGCSEVQKYYGDTPRKAFESHIGEQIAKHDKNAILQLNKLVRLLLRRLCLILLRNVIRKHLK